MIAILTNKSKRW